MQSAFLHIKTYFRWYFLLFLIILNIFLIKIYLHENREGKLKFVVMDVGQGDSLFIESPTGVQVIVDGGPGNNLSRKIGSVLPWYDRHVDLIVVTNPDADHYEGFIKLLDKYSVQNVLEPGTTNIYPAYEVFENKIKQKNIKKILATRGEIIDIGGGAYLYILFPDRDVSGLSPNDGSIVMKLVYGETSALLQGDSTGRIEEYLLNLDENILDSDILKAGHHGSKTSSTFEYVSAVSPEWTVISSGPNNSYGHPNKETLDTMEKLKVPAYTTCNNGSIEFESDGKKFRLKNNSPRGAISGCKL